jgi:hypothetical protein
MSTASFMTGIWTAVLIAGFGLAVYQLEQPFIVLSAVLGAVTAFLIGVAKGIEE